MYAASGENGSGSCGRVPKLDARRGFLFIDELHVRDTHRRRGVASMPLDDAVQLARELECQGVRLLAYPSTAAARALYAGVGYTEHEAILYERLAETQSG